MRPARTVWPKWPLRLETARVIVNLQGDEPEISGAALDRVVALLEEDPAAPMATLATPIRDESIYRDPPASRWCARARGRALLLLAQPDPPSPRRPARPGSRRGPIAYLHLGLYAYRRDFLLALGKLPPSRLEAAEKLEQLRVLDAGYPIAVGIVDEPSVGIDTPEDYRRFVGAVERRAACTVELPGAGHNPYDCAAYAHPEFNHGTLLDARGWRARERLGMMSADLALKQPLASITQRIVDTYDDMRRDPPPGPLPPAQLSRSGRHPGRSAGDPLPGYGRRQNLNRGNVGDHVGEPGRVAAMTG